eukprot:1150789-Pelagomonas_calceolata.AAC.1
MGKKTVGALPVEHASNTRYIPAFHDFNQQIFFFTHRIPEARAGWSAWAAWQCSEPAFCSAVSLYIMCCPVKEDVLD